jgi:hypothetical protein
MIIIFSFHSMGSIHMASRCFNIFTACLPDLLAGREQCTLAQITQGTTGFLRRKHVPES